MINSKGMIESEGRQRKSPHGFALSENKTVYIRNVSSLFEV